jgi:hypothetical protein
MGQPAGMRRWGLQAICGKRRRGSHRRAGHVPGPDEVYASFADLPANLAAFLADSQVPRGVDAAAQSVTEPAWRTNWYVVAAEDHEIAPSVQRAMARRAGSTVVKVATRHAVYMSQPALWRTSLNRPVRGRRTAVIAAPVLVLPGISPRPVSTLGGTDACSRDSHDGRPGRVVRSTRTAAAGRR